MKRILIPSCAVIIGCCIAFLLFHIKTAPFAFVYSIAAREYAPVHSEAAYRFTGKIDINTANSELLCTVSGIGEATARAIIEERETNGLYSYPEDLLRVKGIGEKTLQKIQSFLCISEGD